jgi:hypothetical protein
MQRSDFMIGGVFWCGGRQWRCADIGTRVIIAIRLDHVDVGSNVPELRRTLTHAEAAVEGWFNGPPYAVSEHVFDEYDMPACSLAAKGERLDDDVTGAAINDALHPAPG